MDFCCLDADCIGGKLHEQSSKGSNLKLRCPRYHLELLYFCRGMGFVDTEFYTLIEGYLDDTAHLEYKYTVTQANFINNKRIADDYTYHHRIILPKGRIKMHVHWQYATELTYLYKLYKVKKGHLKVTITKGYFKSSKD